MKEDTRQIWQQYHRRAPTWLYNLADSNIVEETIREALGFCPKFPEIISSRAMFNRASPAVIVPLYVRDKSIEYMADPSQCTKTPWVYKSEKYFPVIDEPWIEAVLKGRTDDFEQVSKDLMDGAKELSKVQPCYDPIDLVKYAIREVPHQVYEGLRTGDWSLYSV